MFKGSAEYPTVNKYDATIDHSSLVERSLSQVVRDYVSGGLPVVGYFNKTKIKIGDRNPILKTDIFGKTVTIDFSTIDDFLKMAGMVLVFICTIIGFMNIVKR